MVPKTEFATLLHEDARILVFEMSSIYQIVYIGSVYFYTTLSPTKPSHKSQMYPALSVRRIAVVRYLDSNAYNED